MYRLALCVSVAVAFATFNSVAVAQNLTVQQPVFGNFSVGTTVSVPDRGGAYIGGVSRAGSGRKSFGPLRSGSSIGLFRDHSGVSTHVTIHDLGEMDRMILGQATERHIAHDGRRLSGRAAQAYSSLLERYASSATRTDIRPTAGRGRSEANSGIAKADRSLRLGQAAEAKGKLSVARLHYRMAARHGSDEARLKLAELEGRSTIAAAVGAE